MEKIMDDKAREIDEILKFVQGTSDNLKDEINLDVEKLFSEIKDLKNFVNGLEKNKMNTDSVNSMINDFGKAIKMKVDIDEVQASLNACQADSAGKLIDLRDELLATIKNQNINMQEQINKKPNSAEIRKQLAGKVDNDNIEQIIHEFVKNIDLDHFGDRITGLEREIERMGAREMDSLLRIIKDEIDEIKKALILKANLQDMCEILDQKSSVDDVNKSIKAIKNNIKEK